MRAIKYRQPLMRRGTFDRWHFWGWLENNFFVGPMSKNDSPHNGYQYTGLLDKHQNEIYEGDILSIGGDVLAPVTFMDGGFHWVTSATQGASPLVRVRTRKLEIIGDICQHPDLLALNKEILITNYEI